jgi:hypothetical protein
LRRLPIASYRIPRAQPGCEAGQKNSRNFCEFVWVPCHADHPATAAGVPRGALPPLGHHAEVGAILSTPQVRRALCSARPWPSWPRTFAARLLEPPPPNRTPFAKLRHIDSGVVQLSRTKVNPLAVAVDVPFEQSGDGASAPMPAQATGPAPLWGLQRSRARPSGGCDGANPKAR